MSLGKLEITGKSPFDFFPKLSAINCWYHLNKSSELIRKIKQIDDEVFLIGVGGVFSKDDYQNKISDGASLIQVYTGFIYEGPSIVKNILSS